MNHLRAPRLTAALTVEQLFQPVPGGSGTYIRELAAALAARGDIDLSGLAARHPHLRAAPPAGLPASMTVRTSALPRQGLYQGWARLRWPALAPADTEVLHATTWAIPPPRVTGRRGRLPLVVTVHDLAFVRAPEHFTPAGVAFFERSLAIARREADLVIVPSDATRDDCLAAGFDPARLHVIPHGVSAREVTAADGAAFRARFGLGRPYLMWCGAIEPRKNLGVLLEAYGQVMDELDADLVLIGPDGWGTAGSDLSARRAALPADRVRVLGSLPWADLQTAYAEARAFVFPSIWEGFGMPVLEAQAHGVPVVTSAGTSMAEVLGDGGLLVNALDPAAVAAGIREACGPRHSALAKAARANAAGYTWQASAAAHVSAYQSAISAPGREGQ
ncbi:MAG: glycosyltransferase family 4 protein [Promicromonosporaceae bacterium]|nr:glycosyltransferase family 4 protein [Promicromonosporaceae bacterium]